MNTSRQPDDEANRESARELHRLQQEGDFLGRSAFGRLTRQAADHFSAAEARKENDPVELWGRRIGRTLSAVAFVALAIYLYATYLR